MTTEAPPRLFLKPISGEEIERRANLHPRWLMEPYIGPTMITCVWSDPGDGKSTFATNTAYDMADGLPIAGIPTTKAGVFYFVEDQPRTVNFRRKGRHSPRVNYWPSRDHFAGEFIYCGDQAVGTAPPIADVMRAYVEWHEKKFKDLPILFIIDTATHFLGLEDGSDAAQVTAALRPIRHVLEESGAALLLIHHANRKGNYGGSIQWVGQVDIFLHLDVGRDGTRVLSKGRDGKQREDDVPPLTLYQPTKPTVDPELVQKARDVMASDPGRKWSKTALAEAMGGRKETALQAAEIALNPIPEVDCIVPGTTPENGANNGR